MKYSYERFLKGIKHFTGDSILMADIGYETIQLYKEEVDECYFTEEEYELLPNICMITAINYFNDKGDEYLMMDVYDEMNQRHLKTIWVRNGEVSSIDI